jgi:hypothetical protein
LRDRQITKLSTQLAQKEEPVELTPEMLKQKEIQDFKDRVAKWLDSPLVISFFTVITIYALFFDDIKLMAISKQFDDIFNGLTLFCIIMYSLEIVVAFYAKRDYAWSFFFFLDVLSTVSMVPDCEWIYDDLFEGP